jgi:hypothetical protein
MFYMHTVEGCILQFTQKYIYNLEENTLKSKKIKLMASFHLHIPWIDKIVILLASRLLLKRVLHLCSQPSSRREIRESCSKEA